MFIQYASRSPPGHVVNSATATATAAAGAAAAAAAAAACCCCCCCCYCCWWASFFSTLPAKSLPKSSEKQDGMLAFFVFGGPHAGPGFCATLTPFGATWTPFRLRFGSIWRPLLQKRSQNHVKNGVRTQKAPPGGPQWNSPRTSSANWTPFWH